MADEVPGLACVFEHPVMEQPVNVAPVLKGLFAGLYVVNLYIV